MKRLSTHYTLYTSAERECITSTRKKYRQSKSRSRWFCFCSRQSSKSMTFMNQSMEKQQYSTMTDDCWIKAKKCVWEKTTHVLRFASYRWNTKPFSLSFASIINYAVKFKMLYASQWIVNRFLQNGCSILYFFWTKRYKCNVHT